MHDAKFKKLLEQISAARRQGKSMPEMLQMAHDFLAAQPKEYAESRRDELIKQGVVTKEGSKFLIFGGTRLEPARDINTSAFTAIDKTQTLSIALPRTDKNYKIVSRQNPAYLGGMTSRDGQVRGGVVEIVSPEEFWSASKYLILVQN